MIKSPKEYARQMLKKHEGLRLKPYKCTAGKLTIGYGRNLEDKGITLNEAEEMLSVDIDEVTYWLFDNFGWFSGLSTERKAVLIDMVYNLGFNGFLKFKKMIKALSEKDYQTASKEMLDSKWATQVKQRANELSDIMLTNKIK